MHKIKIKLSTLEMVSDFIKVCSKYECDINLYDGRSIIDAKSAIGVLSVTQGKEIEVQAISSNEQVIVSFLQDIKKFEP